MKRNPAAPAERTRPRPHRSRFGYDHRWWGEAPSPESRPATYWASTRRPLPSLAFVLPLLLCYEVGVVWLGGASGGAIRAGADAWARAGLSALGLTDRWFPPIALVGALLAWQALERRDWRFRPINLFGMAAESLTYAVALIAASKLVDLGFAHLEGPSLLAGAGPGAPGRHPFAPWVGYLGAGLYEEALFRLALIPLLFRAARLAWIPPLPACTLAITASSLLFSLAHHAGAPGEAFTWFAFIFRWLAGVCFAWVFVARGFGIAVGTHTAYDLLVGSFDFQF